MFGIGPLELVVVFVVALLVMGPKKLPQLARTVGKGMAEFRRASNDLRRSLDTEIESHENESSGPAQAGSPQSPPAPGSALDQIEQRQGSSEEQDSEDAPVPADPISQVKPETEAAGD